MSATVERLSKTKAKITITVEASVFEEHMEKAYRKDAKRFNIPGFRRGRGSL